MRIIPSGKFSAVVQGFFLSVFLIVGLTVPIKSGWATHAATEFAEIEERPAPVFRRVCLAGINAGNLCSLDSDCPDSSCAAKNVFNLTAAVMFNANNTQLTAIRTLLTNTSVVLLDVTDGQAEIGSVTIHNDAVSTAQADIVIHPATNDTWWQANSGHYRTGGFISVSINYINNPANQGAIMAHEFAHLVFDARDEYETRADCGAVTSVADCPVPESLEETSLMDGNGTELCWGQADPTDLTDISGGNHDPHNETEQSECRNNRSVWEQVTWSWPSTFAAPIGAPLPDAGGAVASPVNFINTDSTVRTVLVLDESGSMSSESPSRMERLKVAASDFIATAENGTEVGIVSFTDDADPANGRVSIPIAGLTANRNLWNNAITSLTPTAYTNIGDGLRRAREMIMDAGGVTANTSIILMTDGMNNRPSPQATADADLQDAIDELLADGIPVFVTCTGGDLGLQSQCAEIASGTSGFNSDSSDSSALSENFVHFYQMLTGHAPIDSVRGNFTAGPIAPPQFFVDEGSESASFVLLWDDANTKASMTMIAPDGSTYQGYDIPQGSYIRVPKPIPGDWSMRIDPGSSNDSEFIARGYTLNRTNSLTLALRHSDVRPKEEIYIYATARSRGGVVTDVSSALLAEVSFSNGSTELVKLLDQGRDAGGHGDDVPGDGVYTGVLHANIDDGAFSVRVQSGIEDWQMGTDAHNIKIGSRSLKFSREAFLSGGVWDGDSRDSIPEDDPIRWQQGYNPSGGGSDDKPAGNCEPMDAREGEKLCDGGGRGFMWDGKQCIYIGDLCKCQGKDCKTPLGLTGPHGGLFGSEKACVDAYAHCAK